ncbi:MAG: hypothetical protein JEY99_01380 [Spirochaetales bacterium]|nr:hypothetical protein [Spirochaetales bacterium]
MEKEKYVKYRKVLEKQTEDIEREDGHTLLCHQELAESILREITVLEGCILPLLKEFDPPGRELPHEIISLREECEAERLFSVSLGNANCDSMGIILSELKERIPKVRFNRNSGFSRSPEPASRYLNITV